MIRVKTFATPLRVFKAHEELENLDRDVNRFLEDSDVDDVVSVSDAVTTDTTGAAIGLVRVVTYRI